MGSRDRSSSRSRLTRDGSAEAARVLLAHPGDPARPAADPADGAADTVRRFQADSAELPPHGLGAESAGENSDRRVAWNWHWRVSRDAHVPAAPPAPYDPAAARD